MSPLVPSIARPRRPLLHRHALRWAALTPLGLALALAACGGGDDDGDDTTTPPQAQPFTLTLLHLNDHHSTLDAQRKSLQFDLGAGTPDSVSVSVGGFARVAQAMDELAAASPHPVLKLHAGDALTGTLYFNRAGAEGEADAALMNTVCFDAFALGNHEFDKGDTVLAGFLRRIAPPSLGGTSDCTTQPLSAGVQFGASSALHASQAGDLVKPSMVIERGGERIGVVGLTIAGKTRASSSPDADTAFEDEVTAAQREIDALTAQGVNKVVLLSHIGYAYDQQVIAQLRGVDVVVGGDSHTLLGPSLLSNLGVGSPAGGYPTQLSDATGSPVCLVQAWEYAQVVGELTVTFDGQGQVTACGGVPHVLIGDNFQIGGQAATEAQRQTIAAQVASSGVLRVTTPHARASEVLTPYVQALEGFNQTQVAMVAEEVCSRRVPGGAGSVDYSRSSASCNELGHVNQHGGDVQQLAAQAYLEVTRTHYGGADISLQSGGGARVPLAAGPLTAAQAIAVLPFGNLLYKLTLTADEVRAMLEDGLQAVYGPGGSTGPYPYTGGLRFAVDATAAQGSRASDIEWLNPGTNAWESLSAARTYTLAVLSFNAEGGDGYATLARVPAERRLDMGVLDADVFFEYIAAQPRGDDGLPVLHRLPTTLYSTQRHVAP